jgi:methyl-accepting chemotaxis protein
MADKARGFSLNIFERILFTMILVALIPLGGLVYISGYQQQADWQQNVNRQLELSAGGLAARVNSWIDTNLRALRASATLPDITGMNTERQKPVLRSIQQAYEWSYLVFTAAPDGKNIGRSDDNPLTYYGDRNYFLQVLSGKSIGQEVLIGRTSGKPALILAAPIRSAPDKVDGVIALAMHLVDVSEAVVGTRIGETGYAILVDDRNKAIAHGRPQQVSQALQDLGAHPALNATGSGQAVIYEEGGRKVVAFTQKLNLGWTLIVQQDYDEAFAPLIDSRRSAIILMVIALVMVVGIAYLLSRQLARPIAELTRVAEEISRGSFETKIAGTERRDEIGALARAVERMATSIRVAVERLRKKA